MELAPKLAPKVDPPRGLFTAKVDDKGRLKVPLTIVNYLAALQAKQVFLTSFDRVTAKIYTIPAWESNRAILENLTGEQRQWGKDLLFVANELGEDSELDAGGRFLLPTTLRRLLNMENTQICLEAGDGVINLYTQATIDAKRAKALENLGAKVEFAEGVGLK